MLLLSRDLEVRGQTPGTHDPLRLLVPRDDDRPPVPAGAYNVAAQLLAVEAGVDTHPPTARAHLADGLWLTLRAARLDGDGPASERDIAVTIEESTPAERVTLDPGLTPLVRIHTTVMAGDDPIIMLTAPIPATKKVLDRSGLSIDDIGVYEVNEAFAPVPLAWLKHTGGDPAKINVNGGAIALGHPLGASGTKLMATLVHALHKRGGRYGLQTMCEGGGLANVTIVERV